MRQRHLFLMDPLDAVDIERDSTFALMLEAQRRGHEVLYGRVEDLSLRRGVTRAQVRAVTVRAERGRHADMGPVATVAAGDVDVVWMRKDPPFDMGYIFNTYLLDVAATQTLVVNAPAGLRSMNEKAWALRFVDLVPDSLITQSIPQLRALAQELGTIVVKPLDGNGGEGVFIVRRDDPNIGVILETSTQHGRRKVLGQAYLPAARDGDKRLLLVDGEPVGAINRVPTGVDHRGNIHVGARVEAAEVTDRDRAICRAIGPALRDAGQVFVGIDVIGGALTEVNVTSPTGIHEVRALRGVDVASLVLDAVEARRRAAP